MDDDRIWRWAAFGPALVLMLALSRAAARQPASDQLLRRHLGRRAAPTGPRSASRTTAQLLSDPAVPGGRGQHDRLRHRRRRRPDGARLLLALLVSRIDRGRVLYRAVFILPILIPGIVIGAIWKLMLNFDFGLVNQALGLVGIAPQRLAGRSAHGAALGHRRRHLALDAVLLPALPGRARVPAAGRLRGGPDRRRLGLAGVPPTSPCR